MIPPTLRRCVFWAHLVMGVSVGLVVMILATTGILMSFETQITGAVERSMVRDGSGGRSGVLAPEAMMSCIESSGINGQLGTLNYTSDPSDPVIVLVDRGTQQLFHPATGESLGKGATGTRGFFKAVLSIHRWMTLSPPQQQEGRKGRAGAESTPVTWKDIGANLNAAGCLGFLLLLISGLVLWIPKKWSWPAFKSVLIPNRRLKGRARAWNWHNLAGFWAAPLILVITLTGIILFYPWANRLLFLAVGETPPVRQGQTGKSSDGPQAPKPILTSGLDRTAEVARREMPDWRSMSLELPTDDRGPHTVTVTDAGRGRPDRRVKLTIDRSTFEILSREGFEKLSTGSRLRQLVRWAHTGELGGAFGQTLAALACVATLVLVWTGYSLVRRRFVQRRKITPPATE